MLQAMFHGKLTREEEGMEDLLTSNTFGLIKYLPPEAVLIPFLSLANDPLQNHILRGNNAREILTFLFKPPHTYCDLKIVLSTIDQRNQTTKKIVILHS